MSISTSEARVASDGFRPSTRPTSFGIDRPLELLMGSISLVGGVCNPDFFGKGNLLVAKSPESRVCKVLTYFFKFVFMKYIGFILDIYLFQEQNNGQKITAILYNITKKTQQRT